MKKLFSTILVLGLLLGGNAYAKNLNIVCTIVGSGDQEFAEGEYDYYIAYENDKLFQSNMIHTDFVSKATATVNYLDEYFGITIIEKDENPSDKLELKLNRNTGYLYSKIIYSGKEFRTDKFKCKKSNKL